MTILHQWKNSNGIMQPIFTLINYLLNNPIIITEYTEHQQGVQEKNKTILENKTENNHFTIFQHRLLQ